MVNDPISDFLTRVRNATLVSKSNVEIPHSNFKHELAKLLKDEGYINDYYIEKTEKNKISLKINLKYYEGDPVIKEIKRINPDKIILIDYPGFNLRLAKKLKHLGFDVRYFILPQVWAWKESRAKVLKDTCNK